MFIPFEAQDRQSYYNLLEQIFDSGFWSEGNILKQFESSFEAFSGIPSIAFVNGGSALQAIYEYIGVHGNDVLVPANTFWATSVAAKRAGANVIYCDCNKTDLCISLDDIKKKITPKTKAVTVVHIGGHIAFEIEEISNFCKEKGIYLLEDCAHSHGASYNGKTAGSWGIGGAYSFYATKTMPLGEGGMVVSHDKDFIKWCKYFRNYGKHVINGQVSYKLSNGFNFRMNEFTAALGIVQLNRLPKILQWKRNLAQKYDQLFERRVIFPKGMVSGYYKYIVFDYTLNEETGKVFGVNDFGNEIDKTNVQLPNSYWIAQHHSCVPIWFGWEHCDLSVEQLKSILLQ